MTAYIIRRILQVIPILIGITFIVFIVVRFSGDPIAIYFGNDDGAISSLTDAQIAAIEQLLGLDKPILIQYFDYLTGLIKGDFGRSFIYQNQPALPLVLQRLPATAQLAVASLAVGILLSLPTGILAAMYRNRLPDHISSFMAVVGEAIPNFWLGIMLILLFGVQLGWLPVSGTGSPWHVLMPALALGSGMSAMLMRLIRNSFLDVLSLDYVRTARAKGVPERTVIVKHVLRNASLSYVTVLGLSIPNLLSGSVVTESIFAWPGMGLLFITAINGRDMAVVQAIVLFTSFLVIVGNLLVDIAYVLLDPRIEYA